MQGRRGVLRGVCAVGGCLLAGCLGGDDSSGDGGAFTDDFTVTSGAFEDGGTIPERYTADGENVSPPLTVEGLPEGVETLAVVVDDPDAPGGAFVHWLLWNVPGDRTDIPAAVPQADRVDSLDGARQGTNDLDEVGYSGPAPPADDDPHTYRFTLHAVDTTLELSAGAGRDALAAALDGSTVGSARITGEYGR
jgi:Raf kinase inhibitor-like protein, YbhB/YbcL family